MTQKIKVPQRDLGEETHPKLTSCDPFGEFKPKWLIPDDMPLDEQIRRAIKSHRKTDKVHRDIQLHEVPDISVYTKYNGHYKREKVIKS